MTSASTTGGAVSSESFTILYFASASQYTAKNTERLPAPTTFSDLFPLLEKRYPGINDAILRSSGISVDGEYVDLDDEPNRLIQSGAEVAIIPPVSSG
ncbi:Molybdopterin synthase sulfur carrier subunit [Penicillium maclennaniae]|uniref:Molybdopterin synthase sulfur carrier subunit n=1 Tax=Penicillium maclennaniae TaxID=1343394 RepID=UPI002540D4A8|nr:Molybdopterin synthase sulfur carrier subunit [Penicillium maclennaniae]KAJ5681403.1 Molybdopterin synthase sulfur carrier subunit [Penicillium maclennaniae]